MSSSLEGVFVIMGVMKYLGFKVFVFCLILLGGIFLMPSETEAATKIKTVEVYITQDTSTTEDDSISSGAGVNDLAYSDTNDIVFNIKIPENTVTFRHAYIEWRTYAETPGALTGAMKFSRCTKGATPPKAANCVATDTRTTNTTLTIGDIGDDTAESAPILLMMNVPINSDTLATGSVDYFFNAQLTGTTRTGDNAKIVITYEYDDASATQLNTVRYGVGCADPTADAQDTALTAINPNINEDNVEILSHWLEYSFSMDDAGTTVDLRASASMDSTVKGLHVTIDYEANDTGSAFMILQEFASSALDTLAERTSNHTMRLWSDMVGATTDIVDNKCAEWVITYLFASSSATKTRTVAYFVGANDAITTKEVFGQPAVYLPESSQTHRSVWLRYTLNTVNLATVTSPVSIPGGVDSSFSQLIAKAAGTYTGGGNRFIHDFTSDFTTNWSNGEVITASMSSDASVDAMAELFITSSFADSSTTAIKTVYWFVGQDTVQNNADVAHEVYFTTYVPESVSVASRSTGIIQRSLVSNTGANNVTIDTKVDDSTREGQDDNVAFVCFKDNEALFCVTGFSPSTQLTPQTAQPSVGASLSTGQSVFTAGGYAYSTYEFQWSAVSTFTQNDFRFYVDNNALKPTDPWGNPDLGENAVLAVVPATNDPPEAGREIRFR